MPAPLDAFLAALPPDEAAVARADSELEPALQAAIERGAATHPEIPLDPSAFARHLAAHSEPDRAPNVWLPARNLGDLWLACGVIERTEQAVESFELQIVPHMRTAAVRLLKDEDLARDVVATVRERLVVGAPPRGARLADYGGHGDLIVWARVIAIRAALDQLRARNRLVPGDEQLWELAAPTRDPARDLVKHQSSALIKAAFHAGLAALTPRQRNLLRQHLLDGLTIDELGAIYRVHRVTAARWLAAARADLWAHTRRHLTSKLALSDSAIGDMLDEIRSSLDLSIERALAEAAPDQGT